MRTSGYGNYIWKRLLTGEIEALHDSYVFVNKTVPAKQPKGRIFLSKAVSSSTAALLSSSFIHVEWHPRRHLAQTSARISPRPDGAN